jgi:AcrR family transcriptional regulator
MLEDGYAAVSSRTVAGRAGVTAPLVHFYFPTLDDLFIAAFRRRSEQRLESLTAALDGDDPIRALWDYVTDKSGMSLTFEFLALGNHRKAIRAELTAVAERFRKVELDAFTGVLAAAGVDLDEFPPDGLFLIAMAVPTVVVQEESIGLSVGHKNALALVERYLSQVRGAPLTGPTGPTRRRKQPASTPGATKTHSATKKPAKRPRKAAPKKT